jgi:hypothetical protein
MSILQRHGIVSDSWPESPKTLIWEMRLHDGGLSRWKRNETRPPVRRTPGRCTCRWAVDERSMEDRSRYRPIDSFTLCCCIFTTFGGTSLRQGRSP